MATENLKNDPAAEFSVRFIKGLNDTGRGLVLQRKGQATATVALVMIAKARFSDTEEFDTLIRSCAGIHANAKEQPQAYAAAWNYFSSLGDGKVKLNLLSGEKGTAGEDMDRNERREENAPITQQVRSLRAATAVVYWLHKSGVVWGPVEENGKPVETLDVGKNHDGFLMNEANMLRAFPKKEKSIKKSNNKMMDVGTYTDYTFATLQTNGEEALVKDGVRKARTRPEEAKKPINTVVTDTAAALDKADAKSYDAAPDKNTVLALFVQCANDLNDASLKHFRFTNEEYKTLLAVIDGAKARFTAKTADKIAA